MGQQNHQLAGKKIVLLGLLPLIILLITLWLRADWGNYFDNHNSDPAYLYLLNGLEVAEGRPAYHVDNPGSTVQLFVAFNLKLRALFFGGTDLTAYVLTHPEACLSQANWMIILLLILSIFLTGSIVFRATGNIWYGLLFQASPFISWQCFKAFLKVSPEPFSVLIVMWLCALLIHMVFANRESRNEVSSALIVGFLIAMGLASKLTFVSFVLLPLFLFRGYKAMLLCYITLLVSFGLALFPAWSHVDLLYFWVYDLFFHSQQYGTGEQQIIDLGYFIHNLIQIIILHHSYVFTVLLGFVLAFYIRLTNRLNGLQSHKTRLLTGLVLAAILHILMVAKHYNPHYLIPSMMTVSTMVILLVEIFRTDSAMVNRLKQLTELKAIKVMLLAGLTILIFTRFFAGSFSQQSIEAAILILSVAIVLSLIGSWLLVTVIRKGVAESTGQNLFTFVFVGLCLSYQVVHADLPDFKHRLRVAKMESIEVRKLADSRSLRFGQIHAERCSSLEFALHYGASSNIPQPRYYEACAALFGDDDYFFTYPAKHLKGWADSTTIDEIFNHFSDSLILVTDRKNFVDTTIRIFQEENRLELKPLYEGEHELVFQLIPNRK